MESPGPSIAARNTRPEQSIPRSVEPPDRYGTPRYFLASAINADRGESPGASGMTCADSNGGKKSVKAIIAGYIWCFMILLSVRCNLFLE
jgi:hypothetical protein